MLKEEIKFLKARKQTPKQRSEPISSVIEKAPRPTNEGNTSISPPKSYAQIAALSLAKNVAENGWTEVTSSSRKKKSNPVNLPRLEPQKRRVIFRRESVLPQKSEEDLMLVLNDSLQKAGVLAYIRFSHAQSRAISALLTEKSSAEDLV